MAVASDDAKQEILDYLDRLGYKPDPNNRSKKYLRLVHPDDEQAVYVGRGGGFRRGKNLDSSRSITDWLHREVGLPGRRVLNQALPRKLGGQDDGDQAAAVANATAQEPANHANGTAPDDGEQTSRFKPLLKGLVSIAGKTGRSVSSLLFRKGNSQADEQASNRTRSGARIMR